MMTQMALMNFRAQGTASNLFVRLMKLDMIFRLNTYYRQGVVHTATVQKRRSRSAHTEIGGKRSRSKIYGIPEEVKEDDPLPRKRSNIGVVQQRKEGKPSVIEREVVNLQMFEMVKNFQRDRPTVGTRRTFNRSLSADELLKNEQRKILTPTMATSSIDL